MLIKSMTRKNASFGQLVRYLDDGASDDTACLYRNLYSREPRAVIAEFDSNAALLKARKNGVVLYHEVVSIKRAKALPAARQKEILLDIAGRYLAERAPDCLAYGRIHEDAPHHLHCHLIISANADGNATRHSLKKAQFRAITTRLEAQVLLSHPELEQKLAIGKTAVRKRTASEGELERRTNAPSQKARIAGAVKAAFAQAQSREALVKALASVSLTLYQRGDTMGLIDETTGRKHRLKTLGLIDDLAAFEARIRQAHVNAQSPPQGADQTTNTDTADVPESGTQDQTEKPAQEANMDLLNIALQGLGVIADVTTITRDVGKPIDDAKSSTQVKVARVASGETEKEMRQRIVAERQAQLDALRRGQVDKQRNEKRQR